MRRRLIQIAVWLDAIEGGMWSEIYAHWPGTGEMYRNMCRGQYVGDCELGRTGSRSPLQGFPSGRQGNYSFMKLIA